MWNFLTFQTFMTQDILIVFYYIGAIVIPILMWYSKGYLQRNFKLFAQISVVFKQLFGGLGTRNRILSLLGFFAMFLCMELCWRMMFEMMIGYFDMHDYLQTIAHGQE